MDSPLNRAHQQERKAEQLILSKKYMEAVTCYEVAAGYITDAMKATSASQALLSLQLQHQDHLRKQKILKIKFERLCKEKQKSQNSARCKDTTGGSQDYNNKEQKDMVVLSSEKSNLSLNSSLSASQRVLVHTEDAIPDHIEEQGVSTSMEDLQMQVLSLTQALEDSNRENNHLRNIVLKFKEVLHMKLGFSEDEIEEILINQEQETQEDSSASEQSSLEKL